MVHAKGPANAHSPLSFKDINLQYRSDIQDHLWDYIIMQHSYNADSIQLIIIMAMHVPMQNNYIPFQSMPIILLHGPVVKLVSSAATAN